MTDTVKSWIEERRGIHAQVTEGPWESSYWYHVQGESHCTCREDQGPLVGIDPHGSFGRMHVHRRPEPIWEEGIRTRDDSTGGSDVVVDTDEYGGTTPEDRAAIVDAHNMFPRALNALEQVLEEHSRQGLYEPCDSTTCALDGGHDHIEVDYGEWVHADKRVGWACFTCRGEDGEPSDWPCATVQAIEGAVNE